MVLKLLTTQPADTTILCGYLQVAPLNCDHLAELARLLTDEPLCIYEWQNSQLWRLATQRELKTDSMILKAHQILGGPDTGVELGAVALYLGSCGDYADREAIAKRLSGAPVV